MELWRIWFSVIKTFTSACQRKRTFLWMTIFLMGASIRCGDLMGVTGIIRVLGLLPAYYSCLLDFFHSTALNITLLTQLWTQWVLLNFLESVTINGRMVLLTDGIKVSKEGKKMPGVKLLHQASESNSKELCKNSFSLFLWFQFFQFWFYHIIPFAMKISALNIN